MNTRIARAVAALIGAAAVLALAAPGTARADTVTTWNAHANTALAVTAAQDPRVVYLHLAMVHGAVYDAVNAIDKGHEPYLVSSRIADPFDSKDAAAAAAAYRVLLFLLPAQEPVLTPHYNASLAGIPDGTAKTRGIAVGEAAAAAMIASRVADGRFGSFQFLAGLGAGQWRPVLPLHVSDPNAWIKNVKPFLIESSSQFRSDGPYPLTSRKYAREFDQVKEVGSLTSTTRTADQTHAARYWAENQPRTWTRILQTLSAQEGLSLVENARLFAMMYLVASDALISVWDDKAHYSFWRPVTAIREAATDGNPATTADPGWLPLIANPPYPDHPSGLAGVSGAICTVLSDFFDTKRVSLTDTNLGGFTRSWTSYRQLIEEVVNARVWSGVHFLNPDEQGREMGEDVAKYSLKRYFEPARGDGDRDDEDDDD
jgi:hypothetical protein